ncbi:preprotein translocase subunit SecG [Candidatus Omnitrophota bacterium]
MYILLILIHIAICLVLISVILLQAGRGGGLTEAFGGGETAQQLLGTQAPVILKRATEGCAIAFLVTSLLLGIVTARRGRSLVEQVQFPAGGAAPAQTSTPTAPATIPIEGSIPGTDESQPVAESE